MCIYTNVKLPVLFAFMSLIRFLPLGNSCCFPQRKASSKWITPPILQINSHLPLFFFSFFKVCRLKWHAFLVFLYLWNSTRYFNEILHTHSKHKHKPFCKVLWLYVNKEHTVLVFFSQNTAKPDWSNQPKGTQNSSRDRWKCWLKVAATHTHTHTHTHKLLNRKGSLYTGGWNWGGSVTEIEGSMMKLVQQLTATPCSWSSSQPAGSTAPAGWGWKWTHTEVTASVSHSLMPCPPTS